MASTSAIAARAHAAMERLEKAKAVIGEKLEIEFADYPRKTHDAVWNAMTHLEHMAESFTKVSRKLLGEADVKTDELETKFEEEVVAPAEAVVERVAARVRRK